MHHPDGLLRKRLFFVEKKNTPFLKRCVLVNPSHVYGRTPPAGVFFLKKTCLFEQGQVYYIFVNICKYLSIYGTAYVPTAYVPTYSISDLQSPRASLQKDHISLTPEQQ